MRQALPEVRARRRELMEAVKAIEQKGSELRKSCAEAEREALEDFEAISFFHHFQAFFH